MIQHFVETIDYGIVIENESAPNVTGASVAGSGLERTIAPARINIRVQPDDEVEPYVTILGHHISDEGVPSGTRYKIGMDLADAPEWIRTVAAGVMA